MLKRFKERWDIDKDWQLLFPLLGILGLIYSSYRLIALMDFESGVIVGLFILILSFFLLKLTLFIFKKLENKWVVDQRWEMIRIFIVFALTGSSSVFVTRPIINYFEISKDSFNIFLYYLLFIFVSLIVYQILLVFFGWALGQFKFFWEFEKKMLKRIGFKQFFD